MPESKGPREFSKWRKDEADRAEDAAYVFGFYLMKHCRKEALTEIPEDASEEVKEAVTNAVDVALHNVMDLLEGYWRTPADDSIDAEFELKVNVLDEEQELIET